MREIKFRAWDKTNKKWIDNVYISLHDGCALLDHNLQGFDEDIILLQYTGLKDKNGKEIYEGNIFTLRGVNKIIRYIPEHWGFTLANIYDLRFQDNWDIWQKPAGDWWKLFAKEIEYAGNEFENPELIKEKK